jgi:hypothetical protein
MKKRQAHQVSFAEDCSIIVSGSDHGIVYVFDRRSGATLDELQTDSNDWIQTVLVRLLHGIWELLLINAKVTEVSGESIILGAKSRDLIGDNPIFIWKKCPDKQTQRKVKKHSCTLDSVKLAAQALMLLASFAFIYQNLEVCSMLLHNKKCL